MIKKSEKHLYIYSVRRAREEGQSQFVGLIPKLFGDLHSKKRAITSEDIDQIKITLNGASNKEKFLNLLNKPTNYLNITENINPADKEIIKQMNLTLFDENAITPKKFDKFLEHLYYGHDIKDIETNKKIGMKYGLYFSLKYAENNIKLIESFKSLERTDGNDRIVFYMRFDKFLKYINDIDLQYRFSSPILYLNIGEWKYGIIEHDSIIMTKNQQTNNFELDKFETQIKKYFTPETPEFEGELICQIPLSNDIFNIFFIQKGGSNNDKYIKYKYKYLKLKASLTTKY